MSLPATLGYFGDESFQALNCTALVQTEHQKQGNKTLHTPETQENKEKNCPSQQTELHRGFVRLLLYLRPENGLGPILTAPRPHGTQKQKEAVGTGHTHMANIQYSKL